MILIGELFSGLFGGLFLQFDEQSHRELLRAMPVMIFILVVLTIAYRYYSRFLAYRVAKIDENRVTPAHQFGDGQNYHASHRWVLFGHHFAAISGAGPLIGPVLAMQYGYAPGLLWLVIGVCLAGAVQDMMVLFASVRSGGKSLAEIARLQLGKSASLLASLAILLIVIVALAGLAFVIVKALGGEEIRLPAGMMIKLPENEQLLEEVVRNKYVYHFPKNCQIRYSESVAVSLRSEAFIIESENQLQSEKADQPTEGLKWVLPAKCMQKIPGSSWGTFTIACTIPIALLVGMWMNWFRRGRIVEASLIGGIATIAAVILGSTIPGSSLEKWFSLSRDQTILALCIYGFIASVLPIWLLLTPRDYLSSFMKIGTLILLVIGVIIANPTLKHPPINTVFQSGGPTFAGGIFPFVFICVMCGAISGFHSLVSSGTTPKMIDNERDIRPIGYGAMLLEGLVGIVALISAAALPMELYYDINVDVDKLPHFEKSLRQMKEMFVGSTAEDPLHAVGVQDLHQLNLAQAEEMVGGEALRGRTGGAVTLAVSMAMVLTDAFQWLNLQVSQWMKYWYHFAIMFEALFILTTIDAGTRIARYLFQESLGRFIPKFQRTDWLPGSLFSTFLVTAGWGVLVSTGEISTIWPMFGISNQLLSVMALAIVSTLLINTGKGKYVWVTILPMIFVSITTLSAGKIMIMRQLDAIQKGISPGINQLNMVLTIFVIVTVLGVVAIAVSTWLSFMIKNKIKTN